MDSLRKSLCAAVLLSILAATGCGGGGGGSDDPVPPSPTPTDNVDDGNDGPNGNDGGGSGPVGRLWHTNYALDFQDGTQIAHLSGALPALADTSDSVVPWADGTQFITDKSDGTGLDIETTVTVKDTVSGQILHSLTTPGYVHYILPSPVSKDVILVMWSPEFIGDRQWLIVDVAQQTVLDELESSPITVDWLPDGRYLQLDYAGQISIGTVGGALEPAGSMDLEDRLPVFLSVNRSGTQFAVTLMHFDEYEEVDETDIWVADINGGNAARFTQSKMSSHFSWSPDDRHIAFDIDTGSVCDTGSGSCLGTCELWYAPATARIQNPLPSAPGEASRFTVKDRQGSDEILGCELVGWTD